MGIETDWNCAISLRPLEDASRPDPHRMTSSYADWDVKVIMSAGKSCWSLCTRFTYGVYARPGHTGTKNASKLFGGTYQVP